MTCRGLTKSLDRRPGNCWLSAWSRLLGLRGDPARPRICTCTAPGLPITVRADRGRGGSSGIRRERGSRCCPAGRAGTCRGTRWGACCMPSPPTLPSRRRMNSYKRQSSGTFSACNLLCFACFQKSIDGWCGRRLVCAERETHFLDAWCRALVMQGEGWLETAIQQAWRDLGRGAMTCGAGDSGWWECLRVLRSDEAVWQQLCQRVWQHVSNSDQQAIISAAAAGDDALGQNLSSQMLARIITP